MPESRPTILVVDDCQTIFCAARKYLSQFKLNMQTAGSSAEGLALARARAPTLVLNRMVLPERMATPSSPSSLPTPHWRASRLCP